MDIKVKLLNSLATKPLCAHQGDAAYDLVATESTLLRPGERVAVGTGIAIELPNDKAALVLPRSGRALKEGLGVVNAPGLIDSNYRGEIRVILINFDQSIDIKIKVGDRIAQLLVVDVPETELVESAELSDTNRGKQGFGSSGV